MNQSAARSMPVAVVGAGRMGRHHARTYAALSAARLVGIVDEDVDRAEAAAEDYGGRAYADVSSLLAARPDLAAASIATPTNRHHQAAGPLLDRGIACLIEKPLAPTATEARAIAEHAERTGALVQVGHTERYNPAVRAMLDRGMTARYIDIDRVSPMTFRSMDVSVVMDVMIHDLDIVLACARSPIRDIAAVGIAVLTGHADVASARITFESGCVANLAASRLALKTDRKLRLFSEQGYVSLDYQKRTGIVIAANRENLDVLHSVRRSLSEGHDLSDVDYSAMVTVDRLADDLPDDDPTGDPLTAELSDFLDAVARGRKPEVDARAALAAIAAAERVTAAVAEHRWEGIATPPGRPLNLFESNR